jgi:hypothetical protein
MGGIDVDGLIVFQVKPPHEMHGLRRVDSIHVIQEARQVAGYRLGYVRGLRTRLRSDKVDRGGTTRDTT